MPTNADPPELLIDTSVAIPLLVADHQFHDSTARALERRVVGLAGHAYFETYSVLTRLPSDARLSSADAAKVLHSVVPRTRPLSADEQLDFAGWLKGSVIVGGAVYDALVGWAAKCAGLPLLTRDARALPTYRSLGVEFMLISPTLA